MDELNQQQLEAAQCTEGPVLILAGAGTGKTKVLTNRVAHIINTGLAFPNQVLAVTFTNKAAKEMQERISSLTHSDGIWIGTFHSLSTRIIRQNTESLGLQSEFTILNVEDQTKLLKQVIKELKLDEKIFIPKSSLYYISRWKDLGLFPEDISSSDVKSYYEIKNKLIYAEYQKKLILLNALDFGDLLLYCLKLFKEKPDILFHYQNKFRYVLIDEYQDTNSSQYLWLRYLTQLHRNICAVGDEDQSIYGWRGAEIRNIMKFTHDFPGAKIIRLEQNYRSSSHILSVANHLIANNKTRIGKNLWTNNLESQKVKIIKHTNAYREAEHIAHTIKFDLDRHDKKNIAILVRAGFQTRLLEDSLIQNKIAYQIIGGFKFYDRSEIKDAIAYLRLAYNLDDSLAFERVINVPKRGIGASTLQQIRDFALLNNCSYFIAAKLMLSQFLFRGKSSNTIRVFISLVEQWKSIVNAHSPSELAKIIFDESGFLESFKHENSLESESRIDNLNELLRNLSEYTCIKDFLEHVSLISDTDNYNSTNTVKIMTIHAAKGLEFPILFLPGWEDGVFPSKKSIEENNLEEERRLAYVAITRAKQKLFISYSLSRQIYGEWQYSAPSIFVEEIKDLNSIE